MRYKSFTLIFSLAIALASHAIAGDTVTINMPGGATQTVSASVLSAQIAAAPSDFNLSSDLSSDVITSISQDSSTGIITINTQSGQAYTLTSAFIGGILASYM